MKNLINAIKAQTKADFETFSKDIQKVTDLNVWQYNNLLTATTKNKVFAGISYKKAYLIERKNKQLLKREQEQINKIERIFNTINEIESINITVEWKKNRTWGSNPSATIQVNYTKGIRDTFYSGSIGGCGYDKESTAIGKALNQCDALLKLMYAKKDKKAKLNNRDIFSYGSGYGLLPYFEGGVGTNCYYDIFKAIGLKMQQTANGKSFSVWHVSSK